MLKPNLQLRVSQSLALTPQLQQTIKLLQYSSLELQQQVQQMLDQNPLLDLEDSTQEQTLELTSEHEVEPAPAQESPTEAPQDIPQELALDTSWDAVYDGLPSQVDSGRDDSDSDYWQNSASTAETLQEHLQEQIQLSSLTPIDQLIAEAIILNLDGNGYLTQSLEDLAEDFAADAEVTVDDVRVAQQYVMQLDPVGCGALTLAECLLAQLRGAADDATRTLTARLISTHLEQIPKAGINGLAQLTGASEAEVEAAIGLIRTLNPRPGSTIGIGTAEYVVPDVYVILRGERWIASINPELGPRLRVHPYYSSLIKRGDGSAENRYLREQMQEARWFIKSIQSRNETILRVAEVIVDKQQAFFNKGEEAMRPLVLRDVAEELGMHESTISRVTTQKFMQTPLGVFEFKFFFSSQLGTEDGNNASATAIRALIRSLISDEDPRKPLSDSQIASILAKGKGIKVARRTVAKYREAMQIPSSSDRKRIA
ncbi:MAG: RNA polymerase factor sigma-54 [Thiotrichales bacterium]